MNDAIIISYNPYELEQTVTLHQNGKMIQSRVYSDVETLANELIGLAYQYSIYNVKIHGPYSIESEISDQINKREQATYSQSKITVEGI